MSHLCRFLLISVFASACGLRMATASASQEGAPKQQPAAQAQAQAQVTSAPLAGVAYEPQQFKELVNRLIMERLAPAANELAGGGPAKAAEPVYKRRTSNLEKLLALQAQEDMEAAELEERRQKQSYKLKTALKKKWHKLVDELVDNGELEEPAGAKSPPPQAGSSSSSSMVGVPLKRYRAKKSQLYSQESSSAAEADSKGNQPTNLKPMAESGLAGVSQWMEATNGDAQKYNNNLASQTGAKAPVNPLEHARRILDDKFDIMKHSQFTTNNHLGHKGVPKFGSDEDE